MKKTIVMLIAMSFPAFAQLYYYNLGKKVFVEESKERSLDSSFLQNGRSVSFKNSVLVKLKKSIDPENFFSENNISSYRRLSNRVFKITTRSEREAISLSSKLYETGKVKYAQPNFIFKPDWR